MHILVILITLMSFSAGLDAQEDAYDWEALNRGEVTVESVTNDSGIPGVRAVFLVTASRERVWETLLDYENFPVFFEGIDRMKVLDEDDQGAHVEFWIDAVLKKLHYVLYRDYADPGRRLNWKRVSGDLKDIQGSWSIMETPFPGKLMLVYDSYVEINFPIVTRIVRFGAMGKAEKMAHKLRQWLETGP